MTDDQQPDPSSDSPEPTGEELVSADELAAVLEQASTAAEDLSKEIGADPNLSGTINLDLSALDEGEQVSTLDAQLDELERLVEATGAELDDQLFGQLPISPRDIGHALTKSPDDLSEGNLGGGRGESTTAPDLMAEFMGDDNQGGVSSSASAGKKDSLPTGLVGTPDMMAAAAAAVESNQASETQATPVIAKITPREKAHQIWRSCCLKLTPSANKVLEKVVVVMDVIDRPMERFDDRVRILIGWLAIATMGTAFMLYVYSKL